jgi:hypothetical protein
LPSDFIEQSDCLFHLPHPEEIAAPIKAPMTTATTGLHHKAQPDWKLALTRYRPNPAKAPMEHPISHFISHLFESGVQYLE